MKEPSVCGYVSNVGPVNLDCMLNLIAMLRMISSFDGNRSMLVAQLGCGPRIYSSPLVSLGSDVQK